MNGARTENATKSGSDPCKIRLFSWNVNGLRAVLRKGALQAFLEQEKPDILCLQEIKCKPEQLDLFEMDALKDYQIFWNPAARPGYSGTAILIKKARGETVSSRGLNHLPKTEETYIPDVTEKAAKLAFSADQWNDVPAGLRQTPKETVDRKRAEALPENDSLASIEGRILTLDFGDFFLVNVYTPNSKPDLSRLTLRHDDWDPAFKDYLKELEKEKPVITCGDFNCAHEEIDLARPKTNHHNAGFTDEEREGLTNLLKTGFLDTFRIAHPTAERYTWWSHWGKARENNVGWRIDYFFISESLKSNLKDAEIYEGITGSDHCPISITMEF